MEDCNCSKLLSSNQLIAIVNVLGPQLGPNRQPIQFIEFVQLEFAYYRQSIPQGNHLHMHLVHTKTNDCNGATLPLEFQML
jgi:hypothetical protein